MSAAGASVSAGMINIGGIRTQPRRRVTTTRLFDREGRLVREDIVEEDLADPPVSSVPVPLYPYTSDPPYPYVGGSSTGIISSGGGYTTINTAAGP